MKKLEKSTLIPTTMATPRDSDTTGTLPEEAAHNAAVYRQALADGTIEPQITLDHYHRVARLASDDGIAALERYLTESSAELGRAKRALAELAIPSQELTAHLQRMAAEKPEVVTRYLKEFTPEVMAKIDAAAAAGNAVALELLEFHRSISAVASSTETPSAVEVLKSFTRGDSYFVQAGEPEGPIVVPEQMRDCLVVCDLDGLFLDRDNKKSNLDANGKYCPPVPRYYPGAQEFAAWLLANFRVAAWTSATYKNAADIATKVFGLDFKDKLAFLWCRPNCLLVESPHKETIKPLKLIFNQPMHVDWSDPKNTVAKYTAQRTVMIEDEEDKMVCNPRESWMKPPMMLNEDKQMVVVYGQLKMDLISKLLALPQTAVVTDVTSLRYDFARE